MAPKSLLKTLKYKPIPMLEMEVPEVVKIEKLAAWVSSKAVIPEPTPSERRAWEAARKHLQQNDEKGLPVEGWTARIELMKKDGRLWYSEEDGLWHRRG
jgi:protein-disulfide isomerase